MRLRRSHPTRPRPQPHTLTAAISAWNRRKERLFTEHHVRVATERLKELNWVTG